MEGIGTCSDLRQVQGKYAPFAENTLNRNMATMGLGNMFDNGKSKAGTAELPTPPLVNTIKTLEEPGEMFRGYTAPMVDDPNDNFF